jgi:hypothetical protein
MSIEQPPKVGDKVVYVPERPRGDIWAERAGRPSLVVDGTDDGYHYTCWSSDEWDTWSAPAERLRIVERATYLPVGEVADEPR